MNAPWVTPLQAQAARAFGVWLAAHVTPQLAGQYGFRPSDPSAEAVAPVTVANGVDPSQPTRLLGLPAPKVLAQVRTSWHADRKPANVLLLLDTTGSMADNGKLDAAKQGLRTFVDQASPQDRVGLTTFAWSSTVLVPNGPLSVTRDRLLASIDGLQADGGTALYDAVVDAFEALRAVRDPSHINALVVLTDGQDNSSTRSLGDAVAAVKAQGDSANQVRIFTVAYGADASTRILKQLADASGGRSYTGDPANVTQVYKSISSFF